MVSQFGVAERSVVAVTCRRMTIYRLRSFGPTGPIVAVQRFSADDDKHAVVTAHDMVRGASGVSTASNRRHGANGERKAPPVSGGAECARVEAPDPQLERIS